MAKRLSAAEKAEEAKKEKIRAASRAWYQANKEKKKLQVYAWREKNRDKQRAITKRYFKNHPRKNTLGISPKARQEQLARHKARRAAEIAAAKKEAN